MHRVSWLLYARFPVSPNRSGRSGRGREAVGDGRATHGRILPQPATRQKPTAPRATRATARPENRFGKWSKPPCSGAIAAVRPWPPTGPSRRYGRQQTGARRGRQQAQVAVARTTGYTQRGSPIQFPHRCQNQPSWPVPVSPCSWPWRPRLPGGCSAWYRSTCAATRCWCCWRRRRWRHCRRWRATRRCPSSPREAAHLPLVRPSAEAVLRLHPDLVLAGSLRRADDARTADAGGRAGVAPGHAAGFRRDPAADDGVRRRLGVPDRGAALIAAMDATLRAVMPPEPPDHCRGMGTARLHGGSGTLMDAVLRAAGLTNAATAAGLGWRCCCVIRRTCWWCRSCRNTRRSPRTCWTIRRSPASLAVRCRCR